MGLLNFGILRASLLSSAVVLLLAYALVGAEEHPGIAANAGELVRNAAESTEDAEGGALQSGSPLPDSHAGGSTSFAEYDIGSFSPDAEIETPDPSSELPSAKDHRLRAPVTPDAAEEALAQDIAEAMGVHSGS